MTEFDYPPTMCAGFQRTAATYPDDVALRTPGDAQTVTWRQYADRVRAIACGLAWMGVGHGDTVGLMLTNRPEFHLVDTAALHLGAVPFSIYNTNPAETIAASAVLSTSIAAQTRRATALLGSGHSAAAVEIWQKLVTESPTDAAMRSNLAAALLVQGRRDPFFPGGNGEAIARGIPGARLLVLEEAATAIPDAAAGEAAEAMLALG